MQLMRYHLMNLAITVVNYIKLQEMQEEVSFQLLQKMRL